VSARLREAVDLAFRLHAGQTRRGSRAPYVFHPLAVAGLVADAGADEDQVIAALLHDAVEDAGGADTRAEIARRFGEDVARLVDACSDTDRTPKPPWRERKEAFLGRLRGEPARVRLIVTCDKLHNVRALVRDLRAVGPELWSRFRGGRDGTLWYYDEVTAALADGWGHPLRDELERAVRELREAAAHA
jgi:(p)ppGpp synthase/HD superfamily hydrolase